mmetsp:Transcript_14903/g.35367  ORF Transcript_14903/g.35367 Transcript_14903/m.35367 type:complete len:324 (+) Transcript_14903:659-1630(+)
MVEAQQDVDRDAHREAAHVEDEDVEHVGRHHHRAAAEAAGAQRARAVDARGVARLGGHDEVGDGARAAGHLQRADGEVEPRARRQHRATAAAPYDQRVRARGLGAERGDVERVVLAPRGVHAAEAHVGCRLDGVGRRLDEPVEVARQRHAHLAVGRPRVLRREAQREHRIVLKHERRHDGGAERGQRRGDDALRAHRGGGVVVKLARLHGGAVGAQHAERPRGGAQLGGRRLDALDEQRVLQVGVGRGVGPRDGRARHAHDRVADAPLGGQCLEQQQLPGGQAVGEQRRVAGRRCHLHGGGHFRVRRGEQQHARHGGEHEAHG